MHTRARASQENWRSLLAMTLLCAKKRDGRSFQRRLFAAFGFHGGIFAQEDVDTYLVADKQARYGQGMSEARERKREKERKIYAFWRT